MRNHYKYNKGNYRMVLPGDPMFEQENHHVWIRESVFAGALPVVSNDGHVMLAVGYDSDPDPGNPQFGNYLHLNSNGSITWVTLDDLPSGNGTILDESITYQHPASYEYVDSDSSGNQSGWLAHPYNQLTEVLGDLNDGPGPDGERSHLWIKAGDYTGSSNAVTISKYTDIRSYYGVANIRDRLFIDSKVENNTLEEVAHIRINEGGSLTIN